MEMAIVFLVQQWFLTALIGVAALWLFNSTGKKK